MSKNYISEIIDLTGDSYINPVGAAYGDGSGKHQRSLASINVIGVHHDAVVRPHDYDSVARIKQETKEHYLRLGPGMQYHYSIDNVGQIFHLRPLTTWLYAVGSEANTRGVWIKLDGYFHPNVNQKPTREQYESLSQLIINLMTQRPDIPNLVFPNVAPHSSFSPTACCGDTLRPYVLSAENEETTRNIPVDAVYDWPEYQPKPTEPPVVVPPPPPEPSFKWVQDTDFKPATYIAQVRTHLDGLETGKRYAEYDPGWKADLIARFRRVSSQNAPYDPAPMLLTAYSINIAAQGKRELAGVPEKDMLLAQVPGSQPTPPSPADPHQEPPVVEVPPTPTLEQQTHDYVKENNSLLKKILALLQGLVDKISSIFK